MAQLNLVRKSNPLVKLETSAKKNLEWNSSSFHFRVTEGCQLHKSQLSKHGHQFFMQVLLHTYLKSGNGVSRNLGLGCYQHYGLLVVQYTQRSYIFVLDNTYNQREKKKEKKRKITKHSKYLLEKYQTQNRVISKSNEEKMSF